MISLGISPCPNDTCIFYKMAQESDIDLSLMDVEELNRIALTEQRFILTKLSFAAFFAAEKHYILLDSGGALGQGCGPLLVAKPGLALDQLESIAIPGVRTTAALLLELYLKEKSLQPARKAVRYDRILPDLSAGKEQAGLIIHEDRFTYQNSGLALLADLGAWWEEKTGAPIPLGCIALRKDHTTRKMEFENRIQSSIAFFEKDPAPAWPYIKSHAQAMSDEVIRSHIQLYVNEYSKSFGTEGRTAIALLRDCFLGNL